MAMGLASNGWPEAHLSCGNEETDVEEPVQRTRQSFAWSLAADPGVVRTLRHIREGGRIRPWATRP